MLQFSNAVPKQLINLKKTFEFVAVEIIIAFNFEYAM
jgi:hypothetical protein